MKKSYIGILYLVLMIFGLFFATIASNGFCLGDYLLNKVGLKAWQNEQEKMGLRYTFFYGLAFVVIGWKGATKYLKDSNPYLIKKMPWIFLALLLFVVPAVTEYAKNTYYSYQDNLKAIEYHSGESLCNVNPEGEKKKIFGTIILTNHSKEELKVSVKLINKEYFVEDIVLRDDQNQIFSLHPKQKNYLNFDFYINNDKTKIDGAYIREPKIELVKQS